MMLRRGIDIDRDTAQLVADAVLALFQASPSLPPSPLAIAAAPPPPPDE
jgi:hypothetical protein